MMDMDLGSLLGKIHIGGARWQEEEVPWRPGHKPLSHNNIEDGG